MIEKWKTAKQTVRKDKLKNKIAIVKEAAKSPLSTQDEIVKKTWLWKGTVNRHMQEMGENGLESDIMDRILANDSKIIDLVNSMHLKEIEEKIVNNEKLTLAEHKLLWDLANNSTKRKAIFGSKEWKTPKEVIIQL